MKTEITIKTEKNKINYWELEKTKKEALKLAEESKGEIIEAKGLPDGTKIILEKDKGDMIRYLNQREF